MAANEDNLNSPAGEPAAGMGTGSDSGAPGDHLAPVSLGPEDLRVLAELESDGEPDVVVPVEESPEAIRAVEDDSVLPGAFGSAESNADQAGNDPDDATFQAPQ